MATSTAPGPVRGEVVVTADVADPGPIVFHDRPAPEPDTAAIEAFASDIAGWLNDHLTALQGGRRGRLETVAADGLLGETASAGARRAVTTDLASPEAPVMTARYHVVVVHDGAPSFARVDVTVSHPDGTTSEAGFVFTPDEPPTLVAAGGDRGAGTTAGGTEDPELTTPPPPSASPGGSAANEDAAS